MPISTFVRNCVVSSALLFVHCGDHDGESAELSAEAADDFRDLKPEGGPCNTSCQCQLSTECKPDGQGHKTCQKIPLESASEPHCAYSCQCDYGESCYFDGGPYGFCEAEKAACTDACDCGIHRTCVNGSCEAAFGPFPQCACSENCPNNVACVDGICARP